MEAAFQYQHACNLNSISRTDSTPSLFKNDTNNVAALQSLRLQKRLAEEAARLQKEQLNTANQSLATEVRDRERAENERDAFRADTEDLKKNLQEKNDKLLGLEDDVEKLKTNLEAETKAKNELTAERDRLKIDLEAANRTKSELTVERDNFQKKAEPVFEASNNLGAGWHLREVAIVNMASMDGGHSGTAVDPGDSNGTLVHGWSYDYKNDWHKLKLQKIDPANPTSRWWISGAGSRWLWVMTGATAINNQIRDLSGGSYEWSIEKIANGRGYRITNGLGGCIDLDNPTDRSNHKLIRAMPRVEGSANQIWALYAV